jgi:hypothetical protein
MEGFCWAFVLPLYIPAGAAAPVRTKQEHQPLTFQFHATTGRT